MIGKTNALYNKDAINPSDLITTIRLDQTVSDPTTMITRIVDQGGIEAIRANSHRYTGKIIKTIEDGIYIQDINGNLQMPNEWDGTEADCIVLCSGDIVFGIALDEEQADILYMGYAIGGEYISSGATQTAIYTNYYGYYGTQSMTQASYASYNHVLQYCLNYKFKDGERAYIPSCGECELIRNNIDTINSILEQIEGTKIDTTETYWTANTAGKDSDLGLGMWTFKFNANKASLTYITTSYEPAFYVRPLKPILRTMQLKQLSDSNSNVYSDGSEALLDGTDGDVWMKLPKFYYKSKYVKEDVWDLSFAYGINADDTWIEWDGKDLIGVYLCGEDRISSVSGVEPYRYCGISDTFGLKKSTGHAFGQFAYYHYQILILLYFAYYQNLNFNAILGEGRSTLSGVLTGVSNDFGMTDTKGSEDPSFANYWGIEDLWAQYIVNGIRAVIPYSSRIQYKDKFGNTHSVATPYPGNAYYVSAIHINDDLCIFAKRVDATKSTGYTSEHCYNTSNTSGGELNGIHVSTSLFLLSSHFGSSNVSRLIYRGNWVEI